MSHELPGGGVQCGECHAACPRPFASGFPLCGVIAMAGAFWLPAGTPLTFASKPAPIMFFHGGKDWLVTYDEVQDRFSGYGPQYYLREFPGPDFP
ncbi:hypothetical protein AAAK29_21200 [Mesorhizobium sp. CCNWLW179-1]|uniref:hypothetical protein n=1 Tax=unclassified Mesorhizobium TaxID=325217 RepID=UPI00301540CA